MHLESTVYRDLPFIYFPDFLMFAVIVCRRLVYS